MVQIMSFIIVSFSLLSCHFLPLRSKYSLQNPHLKHPEATFLLKVKDDVILEIWELVTLYRTKKVNKINNVLYFPPPQKKKAMTSARMFSCHSCCTTVNCVRHTI